MIIIRDFILFLEKPDFGKQFEIKSFSSFIKIAWESFLILIAIDFVIGLVISTPLRYFSLLPSQKGINFSSLNILRFSLLVPIFEELIFRLPLRISKVNLTTPLSLILFFLLYKVNIYVALSLSIILFVILFFGIKKESDFYYRADYFMTKYFYGVFYFQALLFGFLHLTNYNLNYKYFYLFPFFVISYIFTGCFFGYIRIRYNYGIYVCIVTHIVLNSIYCLIFSP
jgi:hypothetical protein